ncbi:MULTISPECIES: DUF3325 domain-containing protein [unclassified Duganella]|uniref:DUF3325 domain-containing protein n=1 Tax=unclassified Duganella TaxID=2636909 RepID=UPI00088507F5|nr:MULTISPECIES: DUF3325 domain-containing protein [unclassified Duganella]SDF57777.1 Protein of unknown function [Duganella sp. OV458]SDI70738.1 Protein of unknown function [Duganella sp. OV510]
MNTLLHIGILAISLLGFLALALASERYGEHLSGRQPSPRAQLLARIAGWLLLAVALAWGITELNAGIGIAMWLGWLSVAALVLVFSFPKWPWQPPAREKPDRIPRLPAAGTVPVPRVRRVVAALLLVATGSVFAYSLARVEPQLLKRPDAVRGKIGPWEFTLAEAHREAPELMAMDIPFKEFRIRFCETCDLEIRQVLIKVNKPRNERTTGMAFFGARWERKAEIPLPSTINADSELWLTVVGKDGSVHQQAVRLVLVSPSTVEWFNQHKEQ